MKLYRAHVFGDVRAEGVFVDFSQATAVFVNGKLYVEVGDSLYNTAGWHETEHAAREEAAAKVLAMAELLTAQASRIRGGKR